MAIRSDEAFVLRRRPFRETSLLVTLFARRAGKIKLLIKGVRTEKSSRAALLEPFTHVSVVYYEKVKSDIHLGSDVSILNSHSGLRSRLDRIGYASYITELVDTLFRPHDPHEDVFHLLTSTYRLLHRFPKPIVARVFEVKILEKVGWLPLLTQCALCGRKELGRVFFSAREGGIICAKCDRGTPQTMPISTGTLQSLLFFQKKPLEEAVKLRCEKSIERELERVGARFLSFHLDHPLRSQRFIAEVEPLFQSQ